MTRDAINSAPSTRIARWRAPAAAALCALAIAASRPDALLAQREGVVQTEDLDLHYQIFGDGFPILFLAGGPGSESTYMLPIVRELEKAYQVILLDQRGTGKSRLEKVDASTITLAKYIADVETLRAHLGLDRWILLGHSWGGLLALAVAAEHPDPVAGMILVGSVGLTLESVRVANNNVRYSPGQIETLEFWQANWERDPQVAGYEMRKTILSAVLYDPEEVGQLMIGYDWASPGNSISGVMWQDLERTGYDLRPRLRTFNRPVLVVQGRTGKFVHAAYEIRDDVPGAGIAFIDRCGHVPFEERPEIFYPIVLEFLAEHFPAKGLPVSEAALDAYVGVYDSGEESRLRLTVTREGLKLWGEFGKEGRVRVFPASDLEVNLDTYPFHLSFRRDEAGRVGSLMAYGEALFVLDAAARRNEAVLGGREVLADALSAASSAEEFAAVLSAFREDADRYYVGEAGLNRVGLDLLTSASPERGIAALRLNTEFFPESANTWDSLGDGYRSIGDLDEAVRSYQRALGIQPNSISREKLAEVKAGKAPG
jgi:proline iminopeptidase